MSKTKKKRIIASLLLLSLSATAVPALAEHIDIDGTTGNTVTGTENITYDGQGGVVNVINGGSVDISGTYKNNSASQGGVISLFNGSSAVIEESSKFIGNHATNAGVISNVDGSSLTIKAGTEFTGNYSEKYAGAILNQNANLTIEDGVKFTDNHSNKNGGSDSGGAIAIEDHALSSADNQISIGNEVEFTNNSSGKSGGAIYVYESAGKISVEVGDNALFKGNEAAANGGAVAIYGSTGTNNGKQGFVIGENATFSGNTSQKDGGAIYVTDFGGHDAKAEVNDGASFTNNQASGSGGAIYNAANTEVSMNTGSEGISFSGNKDSSGANDVFMGQGSKLDINGSGTASFGGGFASSTGDTTAAISNNGSTIVLEEGSVNTNYTGSFVQESGATEVNTGFFGGESTIKDGTLSMGNNSSIIDSAKVAIEGGNLTVKDGANVNIAGSVTTTGSGEVINNGNMVFSGSNASFNGNLDQKDKNAQITVENGATIEITDPYSNVIEGGTVKIGENGKLVGEMSVTDAVNIDITGGSNIIDDTGLQVGDSGHIVSSSGLNLSGDYLVKDGMLSTCVIISNGSINSDPSGTDITINSPDILTLSDNAASDKGFIVNTDGTLKLAPTEDGSLILTENNKISGTGNVVVDDATPSDPKGVGTITINSDNSGFNGSYEQNDGHVIVSKDAVFFAGENNVNGGILDLHDGAILKNEINAVSGSADEYGSVHIYNAIESTIGDDGISRITQDVLENGEIKYINSDGNTVDINITGGGLGLFNGTRVEGDTLTLNKDAGVRDLTFGNGSGSEADSIILNEATKLTYADNAYIKDDSTVSIGENASLNFANTGNVTYNPVISSTSDTASIDQIGSGSTVITSTLENYNGAVKVNGGSLDLASAEDKFLSRVSVSNGALHIAGNLAVENQAASDGKITVTNGSLSVDKAIETNDSLTITDANLSVGDYLAVGADATLTNSVANIVNDFATMGDVTIDNTKLTVGGESDLENVTIKGDNSNVTLGKDALMTGLTMTDKSSLNALGNINVTGDMTIGAAGSASSPSINMQSGAINTITADNIIINSAANILFDVDPRSQTTDRIISNNTIGGSENLLIGGINFTTSPIDRNVTFDISNLLTDPNGGNPDRVKLPDGGVVSNSAMGQYLITSSGAGNPILNASLLSINPQMYRGQVATLASWQNQLVVNNMLFDHMNVLTRQLMDDAKTANLRAAAYPQFAPYQYSVKDGSLWYKAYGNFERLSMTKGLSVGNNAYGSLVGADFPQISLKNGWNIIPTAYIAYNGAHQTFNGVSMYQNGAQIGLMGTAYKGDFLTSLLAYGGGYGNDMSVRGGYGSGSDTTGNWFAGVASKTAYNFHLPHDFIFQPTIMAAYNAFGQQNWSSNFGAMSMSSGMLNGINVAPGFNLIWQKKTFSIYATAQMVYNVMGGVDGKAGNIDLGYVRMRHSYFEYGLGVMKKFKDTFNGYFQITLRNGGRTGIGFQGGLQWKIGKE